MRSLSASSVKKKKKEREKLFDIDRTGYSKVEITFRVNSSLEGISQNTECDNYDEIPPLKNVYARA